MGRERLIGRFFASLTGRLMLAVLTLGLLLGASLLTGLLYLVTSDYRSQFVSQVRTQSFFVAGLVMQDPVPQKVNALLDDLVLTGQVASARWMPVNAQTERVEEDFFFGQGGDDVYHVAVPLTDESGNSGGTLALGFDEQDTKNHIARVYRLGLYLAAGYTALLLAMVAVLGMFLRRPLGEIRSASRDIVSGNLDRHIAVTTHLAELADLAGDLETMRRDLIKRNREIAEREVHFRAVVEGASEGIFTLDDKGRILRINTAAEKLSGYAAEELTGMPFVQLLTASSASQCVGSDGSLRLVSGLSLEAQRKDGEALPILLSISTFLHDELRYYTAIVQDISAQVMFEKRLARLAFYDSLTGLPNRRLFHDRLDQALVRAKRSEKLVGIMFLDLDHFKEINDTLGHLFGDVLLQEVSKRLSALVRKEDTVARLGGDEFTVILENISNVAAAEEVAKKIQHALRQPFRLGSREVYVTTSIGMTFYPLDDSDIERLIMNADGAMYEAKTAGRDKYALYTARIHAGAEERLALETALRKAVEFSEFHLLYQPEFVLHYQPEIDRYTGEVVGVEALVRWQHPELGLLGPDRFIPLSEETGLIVPLGEWVLRAACRQVVAWRSAGLPSFTVAVNVSARQLQNRDIIRQIVTILEETGMEGRYLELELTESMILNKTDEFIAILRDLKALGATLSIDDFGTGQSSLANLQLLPVDKVKIDISFVRNITTSEHDAAIAVGIIEMAHKLGMKVVAEGVETEEQLMYLLAHGCDIMQGYHFSRAMAAEDFETLLVNRVEIVTSKTADQSLKSL